MNKWFGKAPFAPICFYTEHVATPVGERCYHCEEVIEEDDCGLVVPCSDLIDDPHTEVVFKARPAHEECFLRQIIGSVTHIEKRCSCFVKGAECGDPSYMTTRQAAKAAVIAWNEQYKKGQLYRLRN